MLSNWISGKSKKDSDYTHVQKIINIISEIRSFKNELNVNPGSFIDISIHNIKKNNKSFVKSNEIVIKKLGRINNFFTKDPNKSAASLFVSGDLFKIYFDENVDLSILISDQQIQIDDLVEGYEDCIDEPIAVDINYGWNMIGFTRKSPMDAGVSFEGILDKVILIKDNSANLFWPEFGFNGLGDLIPGHGYQIKVNDDIDNFIFPININVFFFLINH